MIKDSVHNTMMSLENLTSPDYHKIISLIYSSIITSCNFVKNKSFLLNCPYYYELKFLQK